MLQLGEYDPAAGSIAEGALTYRPNARIGVPLTVCGDVLTVSKSTRLVDGVSDHVGHPLVTVPAGQLLPSIQKAEVKL